MADDNKPSVPKRYKVTPDSEQYQNKAMPT